MLIHDNPTLQTAAETLYRLNMDERFRETCERFEQVEIEHNGLLHRNAMLIQTNQELTDELAKKDAQITDKDAKIAELETLLALHSNANTK